MAAGTVTHGHAPPGRYGVEVRVPHLKFKGVSASWHDTSTSAEVDYQRQIEALGDGPGSALSRVALVIDGQPARHQVVAQLLPNRL